MKSGGMLEARNLDELADFKQVNFERDENSLLSLVLPYGRRQ